MELKEAIENRRSIRKYKDIEVSDNIIADLIDCARLAPSAKNRQPWIYLIVKEQVKDNIADIMLKQVENLGDERLNDKYSSVPTSARVIKEAPILILVFKDIDDDWYTGDCLSIGGAIEHICLRATDLGLGSLWIRDIAYTKKEIANLVGYDNMELISVISIGYPNQDPHQRPRKSLDEILYWYK